MAHAQPTNVTVRTDGRFEAGRRIKEDFQSGPPLLRDGKPLLMPMKPEQRPDPRRSHHRSGIERALRNCAWDKPNCRAIRRGGTPALNAARTAFIWPGVNAAA
jgi:hypothetical protein